MKRTLSEKEYGRKIVSVALNLNVFLMLWCSMCAELKEFFTIAIRPVFNIRINY